MVNVTKTHFDRLALTVKQQSTTTSTKDGYQLDVFDFMQTVTMANLVECIFGG